jgi:hypothetical protein
MLYGAAMHSRAQLLRVTTVLEGLIPWLDVKWSDYSFLYVRRYDI